MLVPANILTAFDHHARTHSFPKENCEQVRFEGLPLYWDFDQITVEDLLYDNIRCIQIYCIYENENLLIQVTTNITGDESFKLICLSLFPSIRDVQFFGIDMMLFPFVINEKKL